MPQEEVVKRLGTSLAEPRFKEAIAKSGIHLIAELKKASPSVGLIRRDFDSKTIALAYEKAGAACLSVLTEDKFFQGSLTHLDEIKKTVSLPILRKDFIIDEYQVYESKLHGADAILLIASILEAREIKNFLKIAEAIKLDVVVEVHNQDELKMAVEAGAGLIGINARSLVDFSVDLDILPKLIKAVPSGKLIICESGIKNVDDARFVKSLNPNAMLVGEALMEERDVFRVTKQFVDFLKER